MVSTLTPLNVRRLKLVWFIEASSMTWAVDGETWANLMVNATLQAEQLAQFKEPPPGLWTYINEAVGNQPAGDTPPLVLTGHCSLSQYPRCHGLLSQCLDLRR